MGYDRKYASTTQNSSMLSQIMPQQYRKSSRLEDVCYDIRGPVLDAAQKLEADGHSVLKLNQWLHKIILFL